MQIFEALGLSGRFLDAGCRQRSIKIHSNGKVLGTIDLTTCGSVYEFNLGISEEVTESILTDYLHQQGGEVHRSSRLVALTPHTNGVLAESIAMASVTGWTRVGWWVATASTARLGS